MEGSQFLANQIAGLHLEVARLLDMVRAGEAQFEAQLADKEREIATLKSEMIKLKPLAPVEGVT